MAASCTGRNIPESMLLFTRKMYCENSALEAAIPTRQPAMLCDLLKEFNSIPISLNPGMDMMLVGLGFSTKLYGLSLTNKMLFFRHKATIFSITSCWAGAPVGMLG